MKITILKNNSDEFNTFSYYALEGIVELGPSCMSLLGDSGIIRPNGVFDMCVGISRCVGISGLAHRRSFEVSIIEL